MTLTVLCRRPVVRLTTLTLMSTLRERSARLHDHTTDRAMLTNKQSLRVCVYNYKGGAAKTTIVVNTAAALAHSMALKGAWCCSKPAGCGTRWWRKADAIGQRVRRKPLPRGSNACCVRRMLCSDCRMTV